MINNRTQVIKFYLGVRSVMLRFAVGLFAKANDDF